MRWVIHKVALSFGNWVWGRNAWLAQLTVSIENRTRKDWPKDEEPVPWPWVQKVLY